MTRYGPEYQKWTQRWTYFFLEWHALVDWMLKWWTSTDLQALGGERHFLMLHSQKQLWKKPSTLTHDTSKLIYSLPVRFLFLMMIGFFHGCLTQTVGGQKKPRSILRSRQAMTTITLVFPKPIMSYTVFLVKGSNVWTLKALCDHKLKCDHKQHNQHIPLYNDIIQHNETQCNK